MDFMHVFRHVRVGDQADLGGVQPQTGQCHGGRNIGIFGVEAGRFAGTGLQNNCF